MNDSDKQCSVCAKSFTQKKNLYAHMRTVHELEPLSKPEPTFECDICNKKFSCLSTLSRHIRQTHNNINNEHDYSSTGAARKARLICPYDTCNEEFLNYVKLREHLSEQHCIDVAYEELTFNSNAGWLIIKKRECIYQYTLFKENAIEHL